MAYIREAGGPRERYIQGLRQTVDHSTTFHVKHIYWLVFQGDYKCYHYRSVRDHF